MGIDALIERMQRLGAEMPAVDTLRIFHGTYTRITEAVRDEIRRGGFADNDWTERWDGTLGRSLRWSLFAGS